VTEGRQPNDAARKLELKSAARDLAVRGMFLLMVNREADGSPAKRSYGKWSPTEFPGPTTEDQIEFDFSYVNACGIWVRVPPDWCVVDPDTDESVAYWTDRLDHALAKAAVSVPPNGRPHWWFRLPPGVEGVFNWSSSTNSDNLKFDVRGQNRGGVMAPPSEHHKGGNRVWVRPLDEAIELTPAEAAMLSRHRVPGAPERSGRDLTPTGAPRPARYGDGLWTQYGKSALDKEIRRLKGIWVRDNGQFNNELNRSCFSIGQLVSGGELSHDYAYDALIQLLVQLGSPSDQYRTVDSGYFDGFDRPRSSPSSSKYFGEVPGEEGEGLLTDTLAKDVVAIGPIAFDPSGGIWEYQAGVYRPNKKAIQSRVATMLGEAYRTHHLGHVRSYLQAHAPEISNDPISEVINFQNGMLNWREDRLIEHSPGAMNTIQLETEWDPGATCPEFDKFLKEVVPDDIIDLVWEVIGYLMYSGNPLHKAIMLVGTGRNGKGTWIRVLQRLLGARNITAVTLQSLTSDRFAPANLYGKLANIAGDIDGNYLTETAKFKAITGQDQVTVEFKGRDHFDFTPWAVPLFSANKIPGSADVTVGYMGRWVIIPFPNSFLGREDRTLDLRLHQPCELRGIAAHAIHALRGLMARGNFIESVSSSQATSDFRRATDRVAAWIADECEIGPDKFTAEAEAYRAYKEWAIENGQRPVEAAEFHRRVAAEPGIERKNKRVNGMPKKTHVGLGVKSRMSRYEDNHHKSSDK
jgi:putative DNA primase/helicase